MKILPERGAPARTADLSDDPMVEVWHALTRPRVPVVFDSPHSGRHYPEDFCPAVSRRLLEGGEDRFIDALFAEAPYHGGVLVAANFARTYIDPNRSLADLDPDMLEMPWPEPLAPSIHSRRGVGLVFSRIGPNVPIYNRLLTVDEVRHRIERCWRPYHAALQNALDTAHARHGAVWHVNCHSMMPVGNELSPDPGAVRPDFVLGDMDGRSCGAEFTRFVADVLGDMGYGVGINEPYKGAEIVIRHGHPEHRRHSLQIEINRSLYMDLDTLARHDGFDRLQADLGRLAEGLCEKATTLAVSEDHSH